jgi:stage IV sporulation protein FB
MKPVVRAPGSLLIGKWDGAPVFIHWSFALGAIFFSRARFAPAAWAAFAVLILGHELGHAFFVRKYRLKVIAVFLHGLGGECHWIGDATRRQRAIIAWGGVVAQAFLFVAAFVILRVAPPRDLFSYQFTDAMLWPNVWLMAVNLMPIPPLDGAKAWELFRRKRKVIAPPDPRKIAQDVGALLEKVRNS